MSKLPTIDFAATWDRLTPAQQRVVGELVIQEHFLRFAASDLQGHEPNEGVCYLDAPGQAAAETKADRIAARLVRAVHRAFPDLFGSDPSAEHPNGTDPPWATPVRFRVE